MPNAPVKRSSKQASGSKLTRDAWITAGGRMLAAEGRGAVSVEKLAREMGVTKGSFYWHFKDRDALLLDIVDEWRRRETAIMIDGISGTLDPRDQIRELLHIPFSINVADSPMRLTLALRLWSQTDPRVRAAVSEVDDLRVRMFANLFVQCGFSPAEARGRATLLYSYMRVAVTMVDSNDMDLRSMCEVLLMRGC